MAVEAAPAEGFYSSTSGTFFPDKQSLAEHYASDLHRYNLKRKVAGLPPVTKDWFDARKEQLTLGTANTELQMVYFDPLTRKKFRSKNAYLNLVNSNKYKELVRKSGKPAPEPTVTTVNRPPSIAPAGALAGQDTLATRGYKATPAPLSHANMGRSRVQSYVREVQQAEDVSGDDDSEWESASDDEEAAALAAAASAGQPADSATPAASSPAATDVTMPDASTWEEWDVRRSLFDNHVSPSFEANLDYMWKHFGFYFPDAEYLKDPEGLLKYLGAKLQYGHVPLGTRGDDDRSRQFGSLHAVQRHMVDTGTCKMAYDDNEEEYEDFYDFSVLDDEDASGREIVMADASDDAPRLALSSYELVLPSASGGSSSSRVLGSRSFALYYRQRHRPAEARRSVAANAVLARYRALNIATATPTVAAPLKRAQRAERRQQRAALQARFVDTENNARRQAQGSGPFQR